MMGVVDELRTLGRASGGRGETLLRERRRADGTVVHELVVNGVFAMDSTETTSERELAGFARAARGAVLVGGLGLGYTAAAVLDRQPGPERVDVVELDPHLVGWARQEVTPLLGRVARDPRTRLHVGDVAAALTGRRPRCRPVGRGPARRRQRPRLPHPQRQRRPVRGRDAGGGAGRADAGRCAGPVVPGPGAGAARAAAPPRRDRPGAPLRRRAGGPAVLLRGADPHPSTGGRAGSRWRRGGALGQNVRMAEDFRTEHDTMGEVRVPARALWKAQTQRAVENFPISGVPIDPALIAALGQIKGAAALTNARLGVISDERRGRHRRGRGRGRLRCPRRRVPDRRLPDRLGDVQQHEHQRGHRLARLPAGAGRRAPQRPRQRLAVQQRRLPERDPHRRHPEPGAGPRPRAAAPRALARGQGHGVRRGRQERPDAPDGRHPGHAGSGVRRLRRAGPLRGRARPGRPPPGRRAAAGRHRRRDRDQHPARLRGVGDRHHRRADGPPAHRGPQPLRGPGGARRARRGLGGAADHRRRAQQDRQRHPLDGLGPARRAGRDRAARPAAGVLDHAGQGEPRAAGRR